MVFVYTTCESMEEARMLGTLMIEKKIAACVDMWGVESLYMWEGTLNDRKQVMLMVTTLESRLQDVERVIAENHSYSVPMIAGVDVRRINQDYKEWFVGEIG